METQLMIHRIMIRVATYNIHKCVGTDRRRDPDRTCEVLARNRC